MHARAILKAREKLPAMLYEKLSRTYLKRIRTFHPQKKIGSRSYKTKKTHFNKLNWEKSDWLSLFFHCNELLYFDKNCRSLYVFVYCSRTYCGEVKVVQI